MAFNGSGTFNRLYNWVTDRDAGTKILASRMDGEMDGFATGLSNALCKDGQQTATANQPMGGFRHTNVGNGTARNHYAAVNQVQDGAFMWLGNVATSGAAITASASPAISSFADGMVFRWQQVGTPSSGATFSVNSVSGIPIYIDGGVATSGALTSGKRYQGLVDTNIYVTRIDELSVPTSAVPQTGALTSWTSGVSSTLSGIPAYAKKISISINSISTNGTAEIYLQLGDSGGIEESGYSTGRLFADNASQGMTAVTSGLAIGGGSAAYTWRGTIDLTLADATTNTWTMNGILYESSTPLVTIFAGSKALSATLTQLRLKSANATDTGDAGSWNWVAW